MRCGKMLPLRAPRPAEPSRVTNGILAPECTDTTKLI